MISQKVFKRAINVLGATLVGLTTLTLISHQAGGPVSVVTIQGTSMEPGLHDGDLLIVRDTDRYAIGDAVAFRSDDLNGQVVLHRIVRHEGDGLVTQGDNNSWVDPGKIRTADVLGRRWIRIPAIGGLIPHLRSPVALVGLVLLGAISLVGNRRTGRGSGHHQRHRLPKETAMRTLTRSGGYRRWLAVALAAAGLVLGSLAAFVSFSWDGSVTAAESSYGHEGTLSYEGSTPKSTVYPDGDIDTGEPVFLRVADGIDIDFEYRFAGGDAREVAGSGRLNAVISDDSGWAYPLPLGREEAFDGDGHVFSGHLDLTRIERVLNETARLTGVMSPLYALTVTPEVTVRATVGDQTIEEDFSPEFAFSLDQLKLTPPAASGDAGDPFRSLLQSDVSNNSEPGPAEGLGERMRWVAVAVALAFLAGAAMLLVSPVRSASPAETIARRHGIPLVPVEASVGPPDLRFVDVASFEDLVRLADAWSRPLLHGLLGSQDLYWVVDGDVAYRWSSQPRIPTPPPLPTPTSEQSLAPRATATIQAV